MDSICFKDVQWSLYKKQHTFQNKSPIESDISKARDISNFWSLIKNKSGQFEQLSSNKNASSRKKMLSWQVITHEWGIEIINQGLRRWSSSKEHMLFLHRIHLHFQYPWPDAHKHLILQLQGIHHLQLLQVPALLCTYLQTLTYHSK